MHLEMALTVLLVRSEQSELLAAGEVLGRRGQPELLAAGEGTVKRKWWEDAEGQLVEGWKSAEGALADSIRSKRGCLRSKDDELWSEDLLKEIGSVGEEVERRQVQTRVPPDRWLADKRNDLKELRETDAPSGAPVVPVALLVPIPPLHHSTTFAEDGLGNPVCGTTCSRWLFVFSLVFAVATVVLRTKFWTKVDDETEMALFAAFIVLGVGTFLLGTVSSWLTFKAREREMKRCRARIQGICGRAERMRGLQGV